MKKFLLSLFVLVCAFHGRTTRAQYNYEPYAFTTFAGIAPGGADGAGGAARFYLPSGVAVDNAGNVYVADSVNLTIRKITPSGVVTTLAGLSGVPGSVDGTGVAARFASPTGVVVDAAGNVYVADQSNSTIRKITPCGVVSTLAGLAGSQGSADGTGQSARFFNPRGVAVDTAGNVYVADQTNSTIRKITPAGVVSTLAGSAGVTGSADGTGSAARFYDPNGVTVDTAGNVYVADTSNFNIRKITPAGVVSTLAGLAGSTGSADGTGSAARFFVPYGVAVDGTGNVYVADTYNDTIRKITPAGVVSTLAGLAGSQGSADGTGSAARFNFPDGVAVDGKGNVYVADTTNNTIREITPARVVSTLAGLASAPGSDDGTGIFARFSHPNDVAVDTAGNVYVADTDNDTIRKVTPAGVASTLAGLAGSQGSADGTGGAARFIFPEGVAVDTTGNVYVADTYNYTIRKITPAGVVTTVAGLARNQGSTDGTGSAARFNTPTSVAVDTAGNIYVADLFSNTIRKITPAGVVTTLAGLAGSSGSADGSGSAARFYYPSGVAVDAGGNVYVADGANHTIRKITPAGVVSTFAGFAGAQGGSDGIGNAARFDYPSGVAVDTGGNVYVANEGNHTIRKITPTRAVTTLGGLGDNPGSDDGTGSVARFNQPNGVAVDNAGNVYVADSANFTIRVGVIAPLIVTTIGQRFVYQLQTTGTISFSVSNLPPGLTFDSQLAAIVGVPTMAGTFQVTLRAEYPDFLANSTLSITVQPIPASGPLITSSTSATGGVGRLFTFQVVTIGGSPATRLSASGLPLGLSVDPVSGVISGIATTEGSSVVTLTVTDGSFAALATLQLTFTADPALPVIISSGIAFLTAGQSFTYKISVQAACDDATTIALIGTLPSGLFFDGIDTISGVYNGPVPPASISQPDKPDLAGGTLLGSVQLFGTNSHGTSTFQLLFLAAPSGAVNISTRLMIGAGENVLIGGFIIQGTAPKVVIIRAVGPSTGVSGALQDPTLELHDSMGHVIFNDNWGDSQQDLITSSGIPPTDPRESAIVIGLDPGNYTAIISGKNGTTGIGLVEVYDLGTASVDTSGDARLAEISTRGFVGNGDSVMIGGFIVSSHATRIIVRAVGPSLSLSGIQGALQDTTLELHDGSGSLILSNDDWRSGQEREIIATTVPPTDDRESAIVATLNPGNYTAIVRGKGGATGVALVEAYSLQ